MLHTQIRKALGNDHWSTKARLIRTSTEDGEGTIMVDQTHKRDAGLQWYTNLTQEDVEPRWYTNLTEEDI